MNKEYLNITSASFFPKLYKSEFLCRHNRFVVSLRLKGKKVGASLPNSGKLGELLIPGVTLLIHRAQNPTSKYPYRVAGVISAGTVIMLNTHTTNDLFAYLIQQGFISALKGYSLIKREVTKGLSRFDFLLNHKGKEVLCEIKSCTLFSNGIGMFPDAITSRGSRHVEELAKLSKQGYASLVVFIIQSSSVKIFLPDYHTDLYFAQTLLKYRKNLTILPLTLGWSESLTPQLPVKRVPVHWSLVKQEAVDSGCYCILLQLPQRKEIIIGKERRVQFKKGYYCYIGSAKKNLTKRIERHQRLRKNFHWHIDYLRDHCQWLAAYPIRTIDDLECQLAHSFKEIANDHIVGFGCSNCACESHLLYFKENPKLARSFQNVLLEYRINRLHKKCKDLTNEKRA